MASRTIQSRQDTFSYNGDLMTAVAGTTLNWDKNGNLKNSQTATSLTWNWDNKLRTGTTASDTVKLKYELSGNRIYKETDDGTTITKRKHIVDPVGGLSQILLEIDPGSLPNDPADDIIAKTDNVKNLSPGRGCPAYLTICNIIFKCFDLHNMDL